jgi:hypothetical protein
VSERVHNYNANLLYLSDPLQVRTEYGALHISGRVCRGLRPRGPGGGFFVLHKLDDHFGKLVIHAPALLTENVRLVFWSVLHRETDQPANWDFLSLVLSCSLGLGLGLGLRLGPHSTAQQLSWLHGGWAKLASSPCPRHRLFSHMSGRKIETGPHVSPHSALLLLFLLPFPPG